MCLPQYEEGMMVLAIYDVLTLKRWKLTPAHTNVSRDISTGVRGSHEVKCGQLGHLDSVEEEFRPDGLYVNVVDSLAGMARFTADYEESHGQNMDAMRALGMFGDDQFWDAIADVQDTGDYDLVEINEAKAMRRACFIMDADWWPQTYFALKWKSTEMVSNPEDPKIQEREVSIQFIFLNRNFEKRLERMQVTYGYRQVYEGDG
ncbi:hypothetical protein HYE67_011262 [Fusarium culmorum]|uniref:Uncharacterized protein n=1 Tax=Fusarium culmorum TaxID=5516 RepID=A0A2T4GGC5_FUSCU|nr:hypothetical protein FCULG_00009202 [Fusarium culmorum]QPC69031.1 hypothetical protein HYE67_011262 [Fusarium culmorum]